MYSQRETGLGERRAAETAVGRIICAEPEYWRSRLTHPVPASPPPPPPPRHEQPPQWHYTPPPWRAIARKCQAKRELLNHWETNFLESILARCWGELSDKQFACLNRIADRLGIRGNGA